MNYLWSDQRNFASCDLFQQTKYLFKNSVAGGSDNNKNNTNNNNAEYRSKAGTNQFYLQDKCRDWPVSKDEDRSPLTDKLVLTKL